MDGTTLRLKTATTKRRTRAQRPSTRRRPGASRAAFVVVVTSVAKFVLPSVRGVGLSTKEKIAGPAKPGLCLVSLMAGGTDKRQAPFLLGLGKRGCDFLKRREMLVDVGFRVLHGDSPLFVPPIRLGKHAAIDHGEPVVAPKIDIDLGPVAVVLDFLRIEHQRAIDASAGDVGLQTRLLDDGAIAFGKSLAELADVGITFARQDFAKGCKARSHGDAVGVVGAAVEDFVLRNQVHYLTAGSEGSERQSPTDGLGQTDHVRLHAKKLARPAPRQLGAGLHFVEDQQRTVLGADVTQALKEAELRNAQSDVH